MGKTLTKRETGVNSITRIHFISESLFNDCMKTIDEIRRDNIELLIGECGSLKGLADILDKSESQVSQLLHGSKDSKTGKPRGMNNTTARLIEQKCGKERGWLDNDHSDVGVDTFRALPPEVRAWLMRKSDNSPQPAKIKNGTQ